MPVLGPIKRRDLIHLLKQLGYSGPYSGGKHQYLVKGELKLYIPNPHEGEIGPELLARILRQAGIDRDEWEKLR
jgi:predicted RNA binding protein YcfA (HicA-like mRNA interferase family)